ncbi:MAG TPA: hypothetical protein VK932_00350 [Kofleriaceae bacterium]|nr:hypothetical protein [Kofleriaceae bacterium]
MSAALMTLFAVSIVGALGMAVYGLRVLLGRWETPRRPKVLLSVAPVNQLQPQPAPIQPAQPQVWIHPTAGVPMRMAPLAGVATPPPLRLPSPGYAPPPPSFIPQALPSPAPVPGPSFAPPGPTWTPPARATSPGHAAARAPTRPATPELSQRLARGSIPPDFAGDLELDLEPEPDTDPGVPEMPETEARVQRGARFSVIRSSRR